MILKKTHYVPQQIECWTDDEKNALAIVYCDGVIRTRDNEIDTNAISQISTVATNFRLFYDNLQTK